MVQIEDEFKLKRIFSLCTWFAVSPSNTIESEKLGAAILAIVVSTELWQFEALYLWDHEMDAYPRCAVPIVRSYHETSLTMIAMGIWSWDDEVPAESRICVLGQFYIFLRLCSCDMLSPESCSKFQCATLVGGIINYLIRHHDYIMHIHLHIHLICMCSTVSTAFQIKLFICHHMTTSIIDFIAHVYNNYCIIYHATISKNQGAPIALGSPDPCNGHMVTCLSGTLNRAGWRETNVQGAAKWSMS